MDHYALDLEELFEDHSVVCDLQGRKINFTNSKTLVSRPTVTRVTFDVPEYQELIKSKFFN